MDGKTLRGSGKHLLSAVVHKEGIVVAQKDVSEKTNEITRVKPLFKDLDIEHSVVTGDALLTQKEIARYLKEEKNADYLFTVKGNQQRQRGSHHGEFEEFSDRDIPTFGI